MRKSDTYSTGVPELPMHESMAAVPPRSGYSLSRSLPVRPTTRNVQRAQSRHQIRFRLVRRQSVLEHKDEGGGGGEGKAYCGAVKVRLQFTRELKF